MPEPEQSMLRDGDVVLKPETDPPGEMTFLVEHEGDPAGTVSVRQVEHGRGELSWTLPATDPDRAIETRALRLLMRYAFEELGLLRLEAYVAPDDVRSLRLAGRIGMRREGVLRRRGTVGDEQHDAVLLARLVDDPSPQSRDGFIGLLNAALPTKRVIAQGLLRNQRGQVLLCELTYKPEWDLPGGVVEPGESPAQGVVREVGEELGIDVAVHRLVTVNWLPPWRGWDDACAFVFDLGVVGDDIPMRLQPTEIVAVHWCDPREIADRAAAATATLLGHLTTNPDTAPYLEIGAEQPLP
jgi:RimJ/RimL family protein N-acetyltransferase/ADP-ribose pyrophosphatase YjhB (NUDIX family)